MEFQAQSPSTCGPALPLAPPAPSEAWLSGGGELGELIRAKDWSQTPLGVPATWPQSLKTTLGILLHSRYPMFVFWGPQLVKIYNDAYRPITGHKHPWALGRPAAEVWPEIWSDIKPLIDRALAGNPTWSDDLLLFMERSGFPEEVYFTFSYSPVPEESGGVGGMFCACTETTAQVLGERRLRTLRDLAAAPSEARTVVDACTLSATALSANPADVPFALVYLADTSHRADAGDGTDAPGLDAVYRACDPPDLVRSPAHRLTSDSGGHRDARASRRHATTTTHDLSVRYRLVCQTGVAPGDPAAPLEMVPAAAPPVWPVAAVVETRVAQHIQGLDDTLATVPAGPWPEPPSAAIVLPLVDRGRERGIGAVVLGLSSRRPFDDEYREWCGLVAAQIGASVSNARAAEDERKRVEALADIDRAKTAFFSNVSHEFRTPLTLLLGPLEDAMADDGRALQGDALAAAHRNALRLLRLVNSLLDFARLESGRATPHVEPVDLSALTTDLASVFRTAIEQAGLRFVVNCPPLGEPVHVDRDMWEKVVLNLLSNAFKFTMAGEIAVDLRRVDGGAELSIRDTGCGIPQEELDNLFSRFHRVRGTRGRTHEGTGIGLALVQELVSLHEGHVGVRSTPGLGSTFTVLVPFGPMHLRAARLDERLDEHLDERVEERADSGVDGGSARPSSSTSSPANAYVEEALRWLPDVGREEPGRPAAGPASEQCSAASPPIVAWPAARIIVADDNADMRDYVRRLLEPRWRVEAVSDGDAALAAMRRQPADLVLADVMMPGLDGFALLRAARQDEAFREVPVVLLSARAGEEARRDGMQAGADDYVVKPFGARELVARIGAALELSRVRRESRIRLSLLNRELQDRVTELETLLSVIPVGIGIALDRDCSRIHLNPALAAALGLPRHANASLTAPEGERPTQFTFVETLGREIPPAELPMHRAAREGREIRDVELDVLHDDGRTSRLLVYAVPLLDAQQEPRGAIGAFVDITERRQIEARNQFLIGLDDALRALADPVAVMARASELLGQHLGASRCAYADVEEDADHYTIPHEYAVRADQPSLVGRWSLNAFGSRIAGALRSGRTLVVHDFAREMPGDVDALAVLNIRATVCATAVREGRLFAMMAVHHASPREWRPDEVELVQLVAARCWESVARARAVRALRTSEERYRAMADMMPQLVWTAGPDGTVDYYSARADAYGGLTPGETGRRDWQVMIHPDDLAPTTAAWNNAARLGHPYSFEHRLRMADGRYRWHLSRAEPVRIQEGGVPDRVKWIGTATDIEELRRVQDALRNQEERLREMDRRKDEFLAILAHELRNPLAPLRTALELVRLSGDRREAVQRVRPMMERQVAHKVRLIDDLLDVSRITSGKIQLFPEPALLSTLVRDALDGHREAVDAAGLVTRVDVPVEPCYVYADPARFVQVLSNLLHNAIKFTEAGGTVSITGEVVTLGRRQRELRLTVEDSGAGIAPDVLPRIFELFSQGDQPAGRAKMGLGIGLALARRLMELHGGTIDAQSDGIGRGARFTIRLPVMELDDAIDQCAPTLAPVHRLDRCRILIIDDNRDAADTLAMVLEGVGAEVHTVYDGEAGIRAVREFGPQAVLLDIGMPGIDGYETCRLIRQAVPARTPMAVLALTGFGQAHDKQRALQAGFDAHLTKPTDVAAIQTALRAVGAASIDASASGLAANASAPAANSSSPVPNP